MNGKKDFSRFYDRLRFGDRKSRDLLWRAESKKHRCPLSVLSSKCVVAIPSARPIEPEKVDALSTPSQIRLEKSSIEREIATFCWIGRDGTVSGHCDLRVCGKAFIIVSAFCDDNELDRFLSTVKQFCDLANASLWCVYPTMLQETLYNEAHLVEFKEVERFQAITDIVDTIDKPIADEADSERGKFDCALFHFLRDECMYPRRVIDTILGDRRLLRAASYVSYQNAIAREKSGEKEVDEEEEQQAIRSSLAERNFTDDVFKLLC